MLAPQLVGKAQQAYAGLSADEAHNYKKLKSAVLQRYDITRESYRKWFRSAKLREGEPNRELVVRLEDLVRKWTKN